jgi:signal transduction histidine kinase
VDAPKPVDLGQLITELAVQCDKTGQFHIHHQGLAEPVRAPETALRQICTNLIENALRHHDKDRGTITVQSEIARNTLVLSVTDDGPGIAPRYQEQVFELFQTLKPRDEVEGSGLGLAIVAKLAARHDGSVAVHSDPATARGCRFVVHLPLHKKAAEPREAPHNNHPRRRSYD